MLGVCYLETLTPDEQPPSLVSYKKKNLLCQSSDGSDDGPLGGDSPGVLSTRRPTSGLNVPPSTCVSDKRTAEGVFHTRIGKTIQVR